MQIDFSIVSENLARTYGDVITPHLLGGAAARGIVKITMVTTGTMAATYARP